ILDLSKIEAGKIDINLAAFNPREYFEDVAQIFSINMQKKGLQLYLDIHESVPETLVLDASHLRQVIYNLLGNAIKFSEMGRIDLNISTFNKLDNHTGIKISVKDQGVGIPKAEHEKIFQAFEQQKNQDKNKYAGTGLGLAISKRLVEQMGGEIHVESELNKGATFVINFGRVAFNDETILLDDADRMPKMQAAQYKFNKACILVADDNYHNRALIAEHFADSEISTIHAENGFDAVNCMDKHSVDLILMDIRMPVMDGYEAAQKIKINYPDVPILALTASVLREDHERIQAGRFDGFLPKPIIKARLFEMVGRFINFEVLALQTQEFGEVEVLNQEQLKALPDLMSFLKGPVFKSWELAQSTQKINSVKSFVAMLESAQERVSLIVIENYIHDLKQNIEAFNIVGIDQNLKQFKNKLKFINELIESGWKHA
ncbi:MAG: ATP-binding protein, partial [Marinicella sp.]